MSASSCINVFHVPGSTEISKSTRMHGSTSYSPSLFLPGLTFLSSIPAAPSSVWTRCISSQSRLHNKPISSEPVAIQVSGIWVH
ncbi:hypothetical protein PGQ11_010003 [Apiospora arundinis]|uniref:Uncharacterized protein n=1 Tax=Apiospora arundinis TaxID=335852 RepID=A0ABR2I8D9_9PEZI